MGVAVSERYIQLHTSLFSNKLFKSLPLTYRHVFLVIASNMAWQKEMMNDHGVMVPVYPGEFMTTFRKLEVLCDEDQIDTRLLQRAVEKLELIGLISREIRNTKTIFRVIGGVNVKKTLQDSPQDSPQEFVADNNRERQNENIEVQDSPQDSPQDRHTKQNVKTCLDKKEQQQAVAVFPSLNKISDEEVPLEEKQYLSRKYTEQVIKDAVGAVTAEGFSPQVNLLKSLRAACKHQWKPNPTKIDRVKTNKEKAKHLKEQYKGIYTIEVLDKHLEIIRGGNSQPLTFEYDLPVDVFLNKIKIYYTHKKQ